MEYYVYLLKTEAIIFCYWREIIFMKTIFYPYV